jgi:hypothetical protein
MGFGPTASTDTDDDSKAAKGIKFDGNLYFNGGTVTVSSASHEGIEAKGNIVFKGGTVYSYASDDAINASGDLTVSGGYVCGYSTVNDGLDANGNMYIQGGTTVAVSCGGAEVGLDANTEGGKTLYIQGGTILSYGGIENGASLSQACISTSWSSKTGYALYDGSTLLMAFTAPASGGTGLVISAPGLKSGSSYTLTSGVSLSGGDSYFDGLYVSGATVSGNGNETSVTASTSVSRGGMGGGNMGGGGMGGPGFGR